MYLKIRTKNHSATPLRRQIQVTTPTVLRLGSTTSNEEIFPYEIQNNQSFIEINTPEACRISSNKILMKQKFIEHEIKTAEYAILSQADDWDKFPAIIKHKFSSKGNGIHYVPNKEAFDAIRQQLGDCENYIIEKYYTYSREYRLHVDKDGYFYTCRKLLRNDAEERWHRHDNNSVWILEENPLFDKPSNWDNIVDECVKAMSSIGLDLCAIDVKVQTNKYETPEFVILETNSAPALGDVGIKKYIEHLTITLNP